MGDISKTPKAPKAPDPKKVKEERKAKNESFASSSTGSRAGGGQANRGYNFSDTTGNTFAGNDPNTGSWSYDPKTGISSGNLPSEIKLQQTSRNKQIATEKLMKEKQQQEQTIRQQQNIASQNAQNNASQNAQNNASQNAQNEILKNSKQSMYDNRGYDYEDTTGEVTHGADPSKRTSENPTGFYAKNKNTGEDIPVTKEDAKSVGQYRPKDNLDTMFNPSSQNADQTNVTQQVTKIPVEKTSSETDNLVKMYGIDKANEIIENKNKIIENNNKVSADFWLSEGKNLGYKEYKVTDNGITKKSSIDDSSEILKATPDANIRFVPTEATREKKLDGFELRRDFFASAKQSGYTEYKTTTDGVTEKFLIGDYTGLKNAKATTTFGLVPNKTTRSNALERVAMKRELVDYAITNKEKYKGIGVDKEIIPLDNSQNVSRNLLIKLKQNPDANVRLLRTQEEKQANRESFEKLVTGIKDLKQQDYEFFSMTSPRDANDLRTGKVVPIKGGVREIIKFGNIAEITPIDYPNRVRNVAQRDLELSPKGVKQFSETVINIEKTSEESDNPYGKNIGLFTAKILGAFGSMSNFLRSGSNYIDKRETKQSDLIYTSKPDPFTTSFSSPFVAGGQVLDDKTNQNATQSLLNFRRTGHDILVDAGDQISRQPIQTSLMQGSAFIFSFGVGKVPLGKTVVPFTLAGKDALQSSGKLVDLTTEYHVGFDSHKYVYGSKEYGNKFHYGKTDINKLPLDELNIPESRGGGIGGYSKNQGKIFEEKILPKLQEKGFVTKEQVNQYFENKFYALKQVEKTTPLKEAPLVYGGSKDALGWKNRLPKSVEIDVEKSIGKSQNIGISDRIGGIFPKIHRAFFESTKGSQIRNRLVETSKRQPNDIVDMQTIGSDERGMKGGEFIMKNFNLIQTKKAIVEQNNLRAEPEYVIARDNDGLNLEIGKRGSPIFSVVRDVDKNKTLHGTDIASAKNIEKFGIDYSASNRGVGMFTSRSSKLINRFTNKKRGAQIQFTVDRSKVLSFKDLTNEEQSYLTQGVGKSKNYQMFQDKGIKIAKERGFSAFDKPYKSNDPNAKIYELIAFEDGVLTFDKNISPSGYGVKAGTDVKINILGTIDEVPDALDLNPNISFGKNLSKKQFSQNIEGDSGFLSRFRKLKTKSFAFDIASKSRAVTDMQSLESLMSQGLSRSEALERLGGSKFMFAPASFSDKHIVDQYMGALDQAKIATKRGAFKIAKVNTIYAQQVQKHYPFIDWDKEIANYKPSPVKISPKNKASYNDFISSGSKFSTGASGSSSQNFKSKNNTENNFGFKNFSSKIFSPKSSKSTIGSIKSSKSVISPSSSKSTFSMFSSKSVASPKSVRSPKSVASPKSIFSPKSSVSPKSIFSPKSTSSPRSTPSPLSIPSPKSTPSPRSTPSPKIIPSPKYVPPKNPLLILPTLDFGKHKKSYRDTKKPSITLRWQVINPIFRKFSILEGKKGRTIEW